MLAGLIAARWEPVIGGLFLGFPAIFPASATLVEKHEREKKEQAHLSGRRRGREAAALEAAGAALGSLGLVTFGVVVWQMARLPAAGAFATAVAAWLIVSIGAWLLRKTACSEGGGPHY